MKTCPVCELALDDSYLFCPDDGSSLGTAAPTDSADELQNSEQHTVRESQPNLATAVVLYCPTCAAEYPLTFSACPVHAAPLVKHSIPRLGESATHESIRAKPTERLTRLHLERPQIDRSQNMSVAVTDEGNAVVSPSGVESVVSSAEYDCPEIESFDPVSRIDRLNPFPSFDRDPTSERPGFRIAAIVTVVALSLFSLVALYMFVSNISRRRATPPVRVATQTEAQTVPFVPTPREARDYKEEPAVVPSPPAPSASEHNQRAVEKSIERKPAPGKLAVAPLTPAPPSTVPASAPTRITRVSNPSPMPALPRGDAGGFDARLVRVRSSHTGSGVRYDLTFNMQEQAGRPAHWQRLLITTRSASGLSHSQAIPFVHRLGATGALTFTISVEMAGRSEADWQGRVVCTTLGWDNNDRPLQASFGANVIP